MKNLKKSFIKDNIKISVKLLLLISVAAVFSAVIGMLFSGGLIGILMIAVASACLGCLNYATGSLYPLLLLVPSVIFGLFAAPAYYVFATAILVGISSSVLSYLPNRIKSRTAALALIILLSSVSVAVIFCIYLLTETGELSIKALIDTYEPTLNETKENLTALLNQTNAPAEVIAASKDYVDSLIRTAVLHLPSVLALLMTAVAYLGSVFFKLFMKAVKLGKDIKNISWEISPGKAASVLYFFSYLLMIFGGDNVISLVASNVMIIFTPAFVVVCMRVLYGWVKSMKSKAFKTVCIFTAAFTFVFNLSMFLTIFATTGAIINFTLKRKAVPSDKE